MQLGDWLFLAYILQSVLCFGHKVLTNDTGIGAATGDGAGATAAVIKQQLFLDCACMHVTEANGQIVFNATLARGAKNNCYMIFIGGQADEIVAFHLKTLQLRGSCLDIVEVFPYLREPVIENTTLAEYVWCNRSTVAPTNTSISATTNVSIDEFIYSAGKVFGLRLTFQEPPSMEKQKINAWPLNLTADYRFLKRDNFKTDGRLIPSTYCDYYFFANTDESSAKKELNIWRYFHSPRFPAKYPAHIKCAYKFLGRPDSRVEIIFEELKLPKLQPDDCNLDALTIFDAESAHMNAVIDVLCAATSSTRRIVSSGPDLLIEFNASSNVTAKGFRAKYKFLQDDIYFAATKSPASGSINSSEAIIEAVIMDKSVSSLTAKHKDVKSSFGTRYDYAGKHGKEECRLVFDSRVNKSGTFETSRLFAGAANGATNVLRAPNSNSNAGRIQCRYEFYGYQHERIQIKFHDFSIPTEQKNTSTSNTCKLTDSLQILTQVRGKYEVQEMICGAFIPKPIMSIGPKLILQFVGKFPVTTNKVFYYGFRAEYKFLTNFGITSGLQLGENCSFVYNSTIRKSGTFHSPNFPGFYLENLICNYYFYGNKDEHVIVRFSYFDVEGVGTCEYLTASDYVEFSNFLSTDRKYPKYCGKLENFEMHSDGRFFRVTLNSNDRFVTLGFRASYDFEPIRRAADVDNTSMQSYVSSAQVINRSNFMQLKLIFFVIFYLLWLK